MLKRRRGPDEFADDHPRGATAIRRKRRRSRTATGAAADQAGCLTVSMAEREGFEPSIRFCRILTFQASAFDHSATAPLYRWKGDHVGKAARLGNLAAGLGKPLCGAP